MKVLTDWHSRTSAGNKFHLGWKCTPYNVGPWSYHDDRALGCNDRKNSTV